MKRTTQLILALDVDNFALAKSFIDQLFPTVKIFKVGSQLFIACGPKIVQYIRAKGGEVFLDLKFHDIPNTVANAVRQAVRLKVKMLTLHICGGEEMLKSAKAASEAEARQLGSKQPFLLGVTVLTSQKTSPEKVLKLAALGLSCRLDGIVCSANEASLLRKKLGNKFFIATPGIRPDKWSAGDQKRVATAAAAIKAGSDFLVVGRPILEADDPVAAAEEFN